MLGKAKRVAGILAGCMLFMAAAAAQAENYALLIGVTNYPQKGRALKGPRNDVALMWNVLTGRGFEPSNITVLADSLEGRQVESDIVSHGLPTRRAILAALGKLAQTAQAGDVVYIHFSGHGAVQPDAGGDEPDRRDEIFLPIDIGQWNEEAQGVENAIVDDELAPGSPLFEGNLDQQILSQAPAARKLIAVASRDGLVLRAGWLDGVVENTVLALYPLGADENAGPIGRVVAYDVTYTSAALTPDFRDGRPGVDMATLPDMTEARFSERRLDLVLRVAVEPGTFGDDGAGKALRAAIEALRSGPSPPQDAAARIEWVGAADNADYVLERNGDHVMFADQAGKAEPAERLTVPAIRLPASESGAPGRLAAAIRGALQRLAKARNIFRYADLLSPEEKIGATLVIEAFVYRETQPLPPLAVDGPPDNRPCRRFNKNRVLDDMRKLASDVVPPRLGHCDILVLELRNQGERAVDVTGLYVDRSGGISVLHDNNPARLHPNGPATYMFTRIGTWDTRANAPLSIGVEKVAFIAVEQPPRASEIADFRVLAQAGLPVHAQRGAADRVSRFAAQLLATAFPDMRGNMSIRSERERAEIRTFPVRVVAPPAQMP